MGELLEPGQNPDKIMAGAGLTGGAKAAVVDHEVSDDDAADLEVADREVAELSGEPAPGAAPAGSARTKSLRERIRDSKLGSVGVVAVATAIILGGTWVVNSFARGGQTQSAEASGKVSEVELADTSKKAPKVGEQAPQFAAKTYDGKEFSLAEAKGTPVWLVFNATWCSTCRAETPDIETAKKKFGDDVQVVAVYMSENVGTVANYSQTLKLDYAQIADPKTEIGSAYRVLGIPTHYFINADGTIEGVDVGSLSEKQMEARLSGLLTE